MSKSLCNTTSCFVIGLITQGIVYQKEERCYAHIALKVKVRLLIREIMGALRGEGGNASNAAEDLTLMRELKKLN